MMSFCEVTWRRDVKLWRQKMSWHHTVGVQTSMKNFLSVRQTGQSWERTHTDRQTHGTDAITSTADAGGKHIFPYTYNEDKK